MKTMRRLLDVEKASGLAWEMEESLDSAAALSGSESEEFDEETDGIDETDQMDHQSFVMDRGG